MQATATPISIARPAGAASLPRTETLKAAALVALFGAFLVWGLGFSPIEALHNAAHDTRHSNSFPCH